MSAAVLQPQDLNVTAALPPNLEIAETDPAHPRNLLYTTATLRDQAAADTKYDILQPANTVSSVPGTMRENFSNNKNKLCDGSCHSSHNHAFVTLGAGAAAAAIGGLVWIMLGRNNR